MANVQVAVVFRIYIVVLSQRSCFTREPEGFTRTHTRPAGPVFKCKGRIACTYQRLHVFQALNWLATTATQSILHASR